MKMEIKIPIQLPDNWADKVVEKLLAKGDFVEVVRCKDCKDYELMKSNNAHFRNKFGGYVTEEDFCSRAQKMDGGTNDDSKKSVRVSK